MYTYTNIYINDSVRFCDTHAPPPLKFFRVGRWWPSKRAQKESIGLQEGKKRKEKKKKKLGSVCKLSRMWGGTGRYYY